MLLFDLWQDPKESHNNDHTFSNYLSAMSPGRDQAPGHRNEVPKWFGVPVMSWIIKCRKL